jgi:hypothetical protein
VRRVRRVLSATAWAAAGFALAVAQGLFGSKLYGLAGDVAGWWRDRLYGLRLWWGAWRTWQGASPDKRARMRREKRSRVKAFDWVRDVGREQ